MVRIIKKGLNRQFLPINNKGKIGALIIIATLIFFILQIFTGKALQKEKEQIDTFNYSACSGSISIDTVRGNSMAPLIPNGTDVQVVPVSGPCGKAVKRDDIIIFKNSATPTDYIKQVRAVPGDSIIIDNTGGTLTINGNLLINSADEVYYFSQRELNFMGLYIVGGKLQRDAYLVFGDNTKNSTDSRKIGAISAEAFLRNVLR